MPAICYLICFHKSSKKLTTLLVLGQELTLLLENKKKLSKIQGPVKKPQTEKKHTLHKKALNSSCALNKQLHTNCGQKTNTEMLNTCTI